MSEFAEWWTCLILGLYMCWLSYFVHHFIPHPKAMMILIIGILITMTVYAAGLITSSIYYDRKENNDTKKIL